MEEEVSSSTTPFDASGQTVFVVEENKNNAIVAERFLKKYKVNVVYMDNPNECIEKIKNFERCNLVLLNENLSGDKSEIVSQIKAADKSMPVVAYTANAIAGMREKYLDAGYDEYLSQPIDRSELRRIMSLFLKMKEMFSGKKEEAAPVVETQTEPTQMVSSTQAVAPAPMPEPVQPAGVPAEMPTPVVEPTVAPATMPEPVQSTVEAAPAGEAPVAAEQAPTEVAPVETVPAVEPVSVEATPEVEVTAAPVEPVAAVEETVVPAEPVAAAPSSDAPASHTAEYLSSEGADMAKAMELLGDMETYDMAAEEFNSSYEESMGKIKSTKEAADWANYAIETHALKSNARYLGFEGLGDIAYEHELAGKEPNPDKINEGYDKLIAEYERVYNVLKKYLES
jgi:CheY-like chemotaxis protein